MADHTSRMTALLGRLRREMNGAVVEAMERAGVKGMLNYGVSIPTIRAIAAEAGFVPWAEAGIRTTFRYPWPRLWW